MILIFSTSCNACVCVRARVCVRMGGWVGGWEGELVGVVCVVGGVVLVVASF